MVVETEDGRIVDMYECVRFKLANNVVFINRRLDFVDAGKIDNTNYGGHNEETF